MRIAILGASSQIAKDMILSMHQMQSVTLFLYVRDVHVITSWLYSFGIKKLKFYVQDYSKYGDEPHDVVINFVGVGDPRRAAEMGASIIEVTQKFDDLALNQIKKNPSTKYVFISSGAVYGDVFGEPATEQTKATVNINNISSLDYYSVAKLYAEVRHRTYECLDITDVRVFNYFSRTQDLNAGFFLAQIITAIKSNSVLQTTADNMVRDYIHPTDFFQLIGCVLNSSRANRAIDCYSRSPIKKQDLLDLMADRFGLKYEWVDNSPGAFVNATGIKENYYSLNRSARNIGFNPIYSSMDCILDETTAILSNLT